MKTRPTRRRRTSTQGRGAAVQAAGSVGRSGFRQSLAVWLVCLAAFAGLSAGAEDQGGDAPDQDVASAHTDIDALPQETAAADDGDDAPEQDAEPADQDVAAANRAGGAVWIVDLDGPVGPASTDLVIRAIEDAAEAGAEALVIRMDTPGGLDKSMRNLVKAILAAKLPVVTYVSPDGARAASAGTYIAYASHVAAMAPATNIGSSTPVNLAPGAPQPVAPKPKPPAPKSPAAEGEEEGEEAQEETEQPAAAGDAMTKKMVNDAVAYLQSLAELRGRNIEWAEQTVREGANLRASAALEANVIDLLASNLADLLAQLDGRQVTVQEQAHRLETANAELIFVEQDWRHELLSVITDPTIAYGLLIIGVYGLILEFYNPGMFFPAATGIICLLLGAYGLQMLPINYAGLALILAGLGMLIAEAVTPTYGVLGVGGVAAFVIGSVMLMDTELPGYQLPLPIIGGFAAAAAAIALIVIGGAVRARRQSVVTGHEGMIGAQALVLRDFAGQGQVRVFGEVWRAQSSQPLAKDAWVRVTAVNGLVLTVEQEE